MRSDWKYHFLILLAGILWGSLGYFVTRMAQYGSIPAYTGFLRTFISFLILLPLTIWCCGLSSFILSGRKLIAVVILGFICQGINNIAYATAITELSMAIAVSLLYTAPVYTVIMAAVFFHEPISKQKWLALLLNIIGCVLTVTGGRIDSSAITLSGVIWGLIAGFTYSLVVIVGRLINDISPYVIATYTFLFASIFLGFYSTPWQDVTAPLDKYILFYGLGLAIIPTVMSYMLYFIGISRIREINIVPVLASVETVVATVIGVLVLSEPIGSINIFGIIIIVLSIGLSSKKL